MSAARAARRRQERAAARLPEAVDGVRLVYQREGGDCLRAAVATVLGIDYDDAPEADGFDPTAVSAWRSWADARGFIVGQNLTHAPAYLDLWIAVVPGSRDARVLHAVVMRRGVMLHNPAAGSPRKSVARREVQASTIVGPPAWVDATRARTLELLRAKSPLVWKLETPIAAQWHRTNGRDAEAAAIEASISKRRERHAR